MARGELRCQRSSRSGARSRLFGAASVAAIGVATLCACGADRDASTSPSDAPTTLFGTPWTLTALTVEGTSIPLPDRAVTWVFAEHGTCSRTPCDDGPHLVGSDGCNSFERAIEFAADRTTVMVEEEQWHADLFACQGPFLDAMSSLLRSESFRHTISGDQLLVTAGETELVFTTPSGTEVSAQPSPTRGAIVVGLRAARRGKAAASRTLRKEVAHERVVEGVDGGRFVA